MIQLLSTWKIIIFLPILFACATAHNQQPTKPMDIPTPPQEEIPSLSVVNIPIRLSTTEIGTLLNKKINGVIYEDNNLEDDGMMMKATKNGPISIQLNGLQMTYRVPLKIWVFKRLFGSRGVECEGDLALTFRTEFSILGDWSISPKTEVSGYEWLRDPVLKTGLVDIPVKYVANIILDRSKAQLTTGIDNAIKTNFDVRKNLQEAWNLMQEPINTSATYNSWVKLTPQSISMTPFRNVNDIIESVVSISSIAEVILSAEKPTFRPNSYFPPFNLGTEANNDFTVNLSADIPIKEAEAIAKRMNVGQTFNPAGKTITITDIVLSGQGDKIIINTSFTGSYSGSLYLIGKPKFNPDKNTVEFDSLDYELQTKNFLLKTARWLFDRTIIKKLKESMVFPVDEKVQNMKTIMNDMLKGYKFNGNVTMTGNIQDLKVTNITMDPQKIRVYVNALGKLNMDVSGLDGY